MPFDYKQSSVLNDNVHVLTLESQDTFDIKLYEPERRDIVLVEPVLREQDYNKLENKPMINNVLLTGNLTFEDLGLDLSGTLYAPLTEEDCEALIANEP